MGVAVNRFLRYFSIRPCPVGKLFVFNKICLNHDKLNYGCVFQQWLDYHKMCREIVFEDVLSFNKNFLVYGKF